MADNKKIQTEELKKLEDQAYFELCQIIAEAMQYQDVELLNSRISAWKTKYKRLLDNSPSNSNFKKRIEFLLTQYYSSVTQYILGQLKLKEEKQIENQSKALRELYTIIRDTNDYDLLKKKVNKWKEKYPVSGFLKMYQKRIELYTRDKNIRENAFKQEEAFRDLVDITKIHGTLDELKYELGLWEEKYSINDKYTIDDFIKHQTEIKRYTSDEFLQTIAREEPVPDNIDKTEVDIVEDYNNKSCSNISIQATAYTSLLAIANKPNNVNELFDWVYKNRYMKFNDKYKELILSATYLNYRPEFLKNLKIPNIDILSNTLTFNEYKNIDEIKRYAILSYFNLLLPPDKAISNDYFNKYVQTIHANSKNIKRSEENGSKNILDENTLSLQPKQIVVEDDFNKEPIKDSEIEENEISNPSYESEIEIQIEDIYDTSEIVIDLESEKQLDSLEESDIVEELSEDTMKNNFSNQPIIEEQPAIEPLEEDLYEKTLDVSIDNKENIIIESAEEFTEQLDLESCKVSVEVSTFEPIEEPITELDENSETVVEVPESDNNNFEEVAPVTINNNEAPAEECLDNQTIVAFSPQFFEAISSYNKQAVLVNSIDSTVTQYIESEKTNDISLNEPAKTKTNED